MNKIDFLQGGSSIVEMGHRLRDGSLTSVALVEHSLRKIDSLDPLLHAFIAVFAREALLAAAAADNLIRAGVWLGPLHGIPVALKDNIDVKGKTSTAGSSLRKQQVATENAWIVQRLLECGAVVMGKTHMVEFALGAWGTNEFLGTPLNPWGQPGEHLSPGGSSSGSAVAVAAGMVPLGIGTDTGASVRVPAALCGITGFKPTIHRLSNEGVVPLSSTLDSVGLLAQTVGDARVAFATLVREDTAIAPADSSSLSGKRIGFISPEELRDVAPEVCNAYERCLEIFEQQGAQLTPLVLSTTFDEFAEVASSIMLSEAAASWGHLAADPTLDMDRSVRPRILAGMQIPALTYVQALRKREALKRDFQHSFGDLDAFLTPASPWTARPLSAVDHSRPPVKFARIGNLLDLCGISVPCGQDNVGRPIGLQIAGASHADMKILGIACDFQSAAAGLTPKCPPLASDIASLESFHQAPATSVYNPESKAKTS